MTHNTATEEGRAQRLMELVSDYLARRNWGGVARLIGGSPRYDHQDYMDADAGETPKGAE